MTDSELERLVARALPGRSVRRAVRIGADRGVFSVVHRVELDGAGTPTSVVVKVPDPGPNGQAAAAAGAYRREALAYDRILPETPVAVPRCHLVDRAGDRASLVLEDLVPRRAVDQLHGLDRADCLAVAEQLARLHRRWTASPTLDELPVRRSTPAALDPAALARGVSVLRERWSADDVADALAPLVERRAELVAAFGRTGPVTLCHGDPRADNLVFAPDGSAVLFDWQQLAVQFPEADLAWLTATSLVPEVRRAVESEVVAAHAQATGADPDAAWERYRLGMLLPGLAVLLLAQRALDPGRAELVAATSLHRIATAVTDLGLARIGPG